MSDHHPTQPSQRALYGLIFGLCGVLLIIGLVFSVRVEQGINHAAHVEATQQSPVPTPPGLVPAKAAPSHS